MKSCSLCKQPTRQQCVNTDRNIMSWCSMYINEVTILSVKPICVVNLHFVNYPYVYIPLSW